ncbi:DUF6716 putative glycosyltransferase [Sanguibacter sp. HDW7]|uniref:DUF6716 putative glycosyltransferase n=1 Tax=Sanguibacter sp. HDW7 TaxID=2714931 RepID=UPI001407A774|nr:DUF6716 putative glycosyltransferase [Sanguibacter sp. HDW7]QIK82957.1 hypothetical protein G7063_04445 [Sanguibacter sp. HDW7]
MTASNTRPPVARPVRILAVADSDSYLKWGAATLATLTDVGVLELVLLRSPILPSPDQRAAAVAGTPFARVDVPVLTPRALRAHLRMTDPDVVLLSATGPVAELVVRIVERADARAGRRRPTRATTGSAADRAVEPDAGLRPTTGTERARASGAAAPRSRRPALVGGLPGMSYPATLRALRFRAGQDAFVVHSQRERREFAAVADVLGLDLSVALAPLPFLPAPHVVTPRTQVPPDSEPLDAMPHDAAPRDASRTATTCGAPGHDSASLRAAPAATHRATAATQGAPLSRVVFAPQAKMPVTRPHRVQILEALARLAAARPGVDIVVKVRGLAGEAQTHHEDLPFDALLADLVASGSVPQGALRVATGPLSDQLVPGSALVTVSSTAALESLAAGVPTLVLEDFGVNERMLNAVFLGSGCLGTLDDLAAGRFGVPDQAWLDDNYLHMSPSELPALVRQLADARRAGSLVPPAASRRDGVVLGRSRRRLARTLVRSQAPTPVLTLLALPRSTRQALRQALRPAGRRVIAR